MIKYFFLTLLQGLWFVVSGLIMIVLEILWLSCSGISIFFSWLSDKIELLQEKITETI